MLIIQDNVKYVGVPVVALEELLNQFDVQEMAKRINNGEESTSLEIRLMGLQCLVNLANNNLKFD